jgi:hypothetical protein
MEVVVVNKRLDLFSYYDYYLMETAAGRKFADRAGFGEQIIFIIGFVIVFFSQYGQKSSSLFIVIGLFLIIELLYYAINKFNPKFHAAKRSIKRELKSLTTKQWQIFERERRVSISIEWLEIFTFDSVNRYHWNLVDNLAVRADFIFIEAAGPCILPKRDFPSEDVYLEFGKLIMEYWLKGKDIPLTTD